MRNNKCDMEKISEKYSFFLCKQNNIGIVRFYGIGYLLIDTIETILFMYDNNTIVHWKVVEI